VSVGSLRCRVAREARSSARIRARGESNTVSSAASRCASIAVVRFENARSCSRLKPTSSRDPLRSGPHATPRRSVRSRSSSFRNSVPVALAQTCNGLASNATCTPSSRQTTLGTRQCVCSCGSPARDVRWANVATANPPVGTCRRIPPSCTRATAARSSKNPIATWVASTTAIDTAAEVSGVPNAHNNDTDFGIDSVTSIARTVRSRCPASSSSLVPGSRPFTRARSASASTTPARPSSPDHRPDHTPGASPAPM
jgi:hypothetical protein